MRLDKIKNDIINYDNKTISLDNLKFIISGGNIEKLKEFTGFKYNEFIDIVNNLIENEIVIPQGKDKKTGKMKNDKVDNYYKLPLKYNIMKPDCKEMPLEYIKEINLLYGMNFEKPVFKKPDLYEKYRKYIKIISDYLREHKGKQNEFISINERSYELFGDEKLLKDQDKVAEKLDILNTIGISEVDLHCKSNYEPLLVILSSSFYSKPARKILIIENLDTFWTFQKIIFKDKIISDIDMLIYGHGNKITGGFKTYEQYEITGKDEVLYFGDIDSAGLRFFLKLKKEFPNLIFKLLGKAYEMLMDATMDKDKLSNRGEFQEKLKDEELNEILEMFHEANHKTVIRDMIEKQTYIPQEALNYAILKERWTSYDGQ